MSRRNGTTRLGGNGSGWPSRSGGNVTLLDRLGSRSVNAVSEPAAASYERDGHVATITYRRPEALNAVDGRLRRDLNDAWQRFLDDDDAWVGILTGAGDRAFSVGADLKNPEGAVGTFGGTFWEKPTVNSFESGLEVFKPTIAAVNGHCLGYGLTAALFCDFIVAVEHATFGLPEVRRGLVGVPLTARTTTKSIAFTGGEPTSAWRMARYGPRSMMVCSPRVRSERV